MCFIAGSIGYEDNYSNFITQKSRGPNEQLYRNFNGFDLMFGLLPITDSHESAMQPFYFYDGERTVIVMCNGEIFNYASIKEEFKLWYQFKSDSDCEVLLPLYLKYGIHFTNFLNGDFSIAIYDLNQNYKKLYLIRDRIGTRSLYYTQSENEKINKFAFSSNKSGIQNLGKVNSFEPSTIMEINFTQTEDIKIQKSKYFIITNLIKNFQNYDEVLFELKNLIIDCIELRIPQNPKVFFGFMLSGGIDSSIVFAVGIQKCIKMGLKKVYVFTIGTNDSPDVIRAKITVAYLQNKHGDIEIIHTIFNITNEECLNVFEYIPKVIETFDITTCRASTMQFLVTKKIKELYPELTVLMLGDFADELFHGYRYFHKAPNAIESELESVRIMSENHDYDLKRVEKCISYFGIEGRPPYTDYRLIQFYQTINPEFKWCGNDNIEKKLVRDSFTGFLPNEILYAPKIAFSDGTTNINDIWHKTIERYVENLYTDEEFNERIKKYENYLKPHNKEALYIHENFDKYFPNQFHILEKYWLPNWVECNGNPSASVLEGYQT